MYQLKRHSPADRKWYTKCNVSEQLSDVARVRDMLLRACVSAYLFKATRHVWAYVWRPSQLWKECYICTGRAAKPRGTERHGPWAGNATAAEEGLAESARYEEGQGETWGKLAALRGEKGEGCWNLHGRELYRTPSIGTTVRGREFLQNIGQHVSTWRTAVLPGRGQVPSISQGNYRQQKSQHMSPWRSLNHALVSGFAFRNKSAQGFNLAVSAALEAVWFYMLQNIDGNHTYKIYKDLHR